MAEMEELLLQAEGILYLLELEKLKVLADKLKVPKKDVVVYEENFEKSTQQEFEALLNELKKFGELSPPPLEGDEVEETSTVPGCAEGAEGDKTRIKTTHTTQPDNLTMQTSMFRREFKIIGQIEEVGQREKLSYVSLIRQVEVGEESENDLKYSPVLVTGLFRQSVETGLLSDAIRGRIRPYLQNSNVDDEELINQMQLAVLAESERKKKFGLQNKASKVNEISIVEKNPQKQAKISENNDKILAAVEQIKCGVAALKTELAEMKTANYGKEQQKSSLSKPTCESCRKTGKTDCDHCSYCGSPDHNFRGCRNRKSGNGGRLPRRGGPETIERPIIGYNVIEEIICGNIEDSVGKEAVLSSIQRSFTNMSDHKASALIHLVYNSQTQNEFCDVKTTKKDFVIQKNTTIDVSCRANTSYLERHTPMIF
eukprot:gene9654-17415_t